MRFVRIRRTQKRGCNIVFPRGDLNGENFCKLGRILTAQCWFDICQSRLYVFFVGGILRTERGLYCTCSRDSRFMMFIRRALFSEQLMMKQPDAVSSSTDT